MEFDKLRGDYKEAMESIDLSKDSRERILSNIRLEDLSVPAEKQATRKRIPLFVILPVAGAAFAALAVFGFMLGLATHSAGTKNQAELALKTHNKDIEQISGDKIDSYIENDKDGPEDETQTYKVDQNFISSGTKGIIGGDKSMPASAAGESILGTLSFLPFAEYTETVETDDRYGIDVRRYNETGGSEDTITVIVSGGINDIGGSAEEIKVDGKDAILYGSKDKDEYNKAIFITDDNMFFVIESGKTYGKAVWENIVKGAAVEAS